VEEIKIERATNGGAPAFNSNPRATCQERARQDSNLSLRFPSFLRKLVSRHIPHERDGDHRCDAHRPGDGESRPSESIVAATAATDCVIELPGVVSRKQQLASRLLGAG
jgi:hypothetical protein